jgi:hypothetical protein
VFVSHTPSPALRPTTLNTEQQDKHAHAIVQQRPDLEATAPPSSRPTAAREQLEAYQRVLSESAKLDRYAQRAFSRGNRAMRRLIAKRVLAQPLGRPTESGQAHLEQGGD